MSRYRQHYLPSHARRRRVALRDALNWIAPIACVLGTGFILYVLLVAAMTI